MSASSHTDLSLVFKRKSFIAIRRSISNNTVWCYENMQLFSNIFVASDAIYRTVCKTLLINMSETLFSITLLPLQHANYQHLEKFILKCLMGLDPRTLVRKIIIISWVKHLLEPDINITTCKCMLITNWMFISFLLVFLLKHNSIHDNCMICCVKVTTI